jgi:hypothetical protein
LPRVTQMEYRLNCVRASEESLEMRAESAGFGRVRRNRADESSDSLQGMAS